MLNSQVQLSMMTGWLGAFSAINVWFTQARLPGGFFGIVMIAAEIMEFGGDLLVSGLVKPIEIPGRCEFGTGVVIPAVPVTWPSVPDAFQPAYTMVTQAQTSSQQNGGLSGIFRKVNGDLNFRAASQDIVGHWICQDIQQDIHYNTSVSYEYVVADLIGKGYLNNNTNHYLSSGFPDGSWDRLLSWSPSVQDGVEEPWGVKVSYDAAMGDNVMHVMRSYDCIMDGKSVEWILSLMYAQTTLTDWTDLTMGKIYENNNWSQSATVAAILESTLEAMVMIGWGGDVNTTSPPIGDPTQGCLVTYAGVPWPVFSLLVLATVLVLLAIVFWVVSSLKLRHLQKSKRPPFAKAVQEVTPNGLVDWMVQAGREHDMHVTENLTTKDITRWKFGQDDEGRLSLCSCQLRIERDGDQKVQITQST
jgi:hypothetical protein